MDYNKNLYGEHFENWKIKAEKRRKKSRIILVALLVVFIVFTVAVIFTLNKKSSPLIGTWVYDSYTQYVFKKDGSGCLKVDDVTYDYSYKITANKLTLDFSEDVVRDCEYIFSIDENGLTLVGGENTDGGTYTLKKQ